MKFNVFRNALLSLTVLLAVSCGEAESDKADWITINQVSDKDLNKDAIALLGLPKSDPAAETATVLRWENVEGIKEISVFNNGSNKIDYIYVKANTK